MTTVPALWLQADSGGVPSTALLGASLVVFLVIMVIALVFIIAMWKVYTKAGQPGWAILIPIYNVYILLKLAGRPGWWVILYFIPLVNLVIAILVAIDVAKSFGQSAAFGVILLFLLCGIGYLMLGFGNYTYVGPAALAKQ
ncbi:MAG: DUF5684 domain-containing protein [Bryobacteraceae bacterium]|jgi:hypothetical protein